MRWLTLAITIWKFIFQFNTFEDQAEINFYSFLFMYPFNINAPTKLNVLMDSEILMCLIGSGEMCEAAALKMLPRYFSIVSSLLHDIIGLVVKTKSGSWTIHTVRFNKPHRKLSIMTSTFTEHFPSDKRFENILLPCYLQQQNNITDILSLWRETQKYEQWGTCWVVCSVILPGWSIPWLKVIYCYKMASNRDRGLSRL